MQRRCSATLAIAAGVVALTAPVPGMACSPSYPITVEYDGPPPNYRADCRAAWRQRDQLVSAIKDASVEYRDIAHLAYAFRDGSNGCGKRPAVAFALVDAAIGSPVRLATYDTAVSTFFDWADENTPQERIEEVRVGSWLLSALRANRGGGMCEPRPYYDVSVPSDVSQDKLRAYIIDERYWPSVIERFGSNPGRDRLVLRELIDPTSERFDLQLAGELAPKFFHGHRPEGFLPILVDVAEAIADPRLGVPNYEGAAQILEVYSPYAPNNLGEEASARARALWVRIAQTRLSSPDPQLRRDARIALRLADPSARAGAVFEDVLGQGAEVLVLEQWPESLPRLRNLDASIARIINHYPSRALRSQHGGRVELGILFKPDGSFHSVHIMRSAGRALDQAASRGAMRYLRPRLAKTTLTGFEGQYVYVPLPSFEYWLSGSEDVRRGKVESGFDGETFTIVGEMLVPPWRP